MTEKGNDARCLHTQAESLYKKITNYVEGVRDGKICLDSAYTPFQQMAGFSARYLVLVRELVEMSGSPDPTKGPPDLVGGMLHNVPLQCMLLSNYNDYAAENWEISTAAEQKIRVEAGGDKGLETELRIQEEQKITQRRLSEVYPYYDLAGLEFLKAFMDVLQNGPSHIKEGREHVFRHQSREVEHILGFAVDYRTKPKPVAVLAPEPPQA